MDLINTPEAALLAIPFLLMGLNEFLKRVGMDSRWCPFVNVGVGTTMAVYPLVMLGLEPYFVGFTATCIGLAAGGFYSGIKSVAKL